MRWRRVGWVSKKTIFGSTKVNKTVAKFTGFVIFPIWMNSPLGAHDKFGFSLIEVTIAIGIAGFALLAVLGAISTGSNIQRQAINATVQAQIMQGVLGSLRQSDWTRLTNYSGTNLFFDERGVAANAAAAIYTAKPTVDTLVSLPGAAANTNMARVSVQILKNNSTNDSVTVSAIIANNGQ
jgi:uncharacterized protein (TIGR02598 family)